jgi:hypothetical protein
MLFRKGSLLLSLLLLGCLACSKRPVARIPEVLVGTWTTDAPAYRDRYLKLEQDYVIYGLGEERNPNAQRVTRVESQQTGFITTYVIYSTDAQGPHPMTLSYDPSNGTVRVKNQKDAVWRRTNATAPQSQ